MEQSKIDRINELARKSKTTELTEEEKEEQKILRTEYIASVKASLVGHLENTSIVRPDGSVHKVKKRDKKN